MISGAKQSTSRAASSPPGFPAESMSHPRSVSGFVPASYSSRAGRSLSRAWARWILTSSTQHFSEVEIVVERPHVKAMTIATKKVLSTSSAPNRHWVGDGFPVHGMFGYTGDTKRISPFLLLDYAAPTRFEPTAQRRGVGQHPHRGFETVTIVYDGEVEHRDSTGSGGVIGPGDVQWMTAGGGIIHE